MHWIEIVEFSFYLVETFALPFAILVFVIERRKERFVDEEEIYQRLSDEYTNFLKLVLDNSDLQLLRKSAPLGAAERRTNGAEAGAVRDSGLDFRTCLYPGLRRAHEQADAPPLVVLGRLHARMVSSGRFPPGAAGVIGGRRSGFQSAY